MKKLMLTVFTLLIPCGLIAQDKPRWGVQGDFGYAEIPKFVVEKFSREFPEIPAITGNGFGAGVVRFHANGAPSFAFQFVSQSVHLTGERSYGGPYRGRVNGTGTVQGFMATKYVNVVAKKRVSGGFAFGAGIGQLEGNYARDTVDPRTGSWVNAQNKSYQRTIPMFEVLGRVDVRLARFLSVGPYAGLRNGLFVAGVAIRF